MSRLACHRPGLMVREGVLKGWYSTKAYPLSTQPQYVKDLLQQKEDGQPMLTPRAENGCL